MESQHKSATRPVLLHNLDQYFDLDDSLPIDFRTSNNNNALVSDPTFPLSSDSVPLPFMASFDRVAAETSCAICMEEFDTPAATDECCCHDDPFYGEKHEIPPGHHMYHRSCISTWLAVHASCPLCRKSLITGTG